MNTIFLEIDSPRVQLFKLHKLFIKTINRQCQLSNMTK